MKKTIGHRGVETTTGETTYKKVSVAGGFYPLTTWLQNENKAPKIFAILKLVETFSRLLRIVSCSQAKKKNDMLDVFSRQTTSSALKGAIQLGITHTVGSLSQKAERDVLMQDFVVVESIFFPR